MTKIVGIIPARFASTRLPGKPLLDISGISMIQRVYEQALKCPFLSDVIVATDDERIQQHVKSFSGKVAMTSQDHQSGTDRCAEVIGQLLVKPDIIINIQGDEPFIDPEQISIVASCFEDPETEIASLCKKIPSEQEAQNPNTVKVVMNVNGKALYFSRSPIPYHRNQNVQVSYMKHIGIYGYRMDILQKISSLSPSVHEIAESLEQLRWLENGFSITMKETQLETLSIDSPDDLKHVEKYLKK
jgi:3-deoxy-manno-octulosonate cytidylyltransferase (CMP-KDO synthetase)